MGKLINPPQKKIYTKFKKKKRPLFGDKHVRLIKAVSLILLAAIILSVGLGIFLNWYFVDTKYDSPLFKSRVALPDINSITLNKDAIEKSFLYYKKSFIRKYSSFQPVTTGEILEGYNVTIDGIGYFVNGDTVDTAPYSKSKLDDYEITDIGNHVTESGSSFFPEIQSALIGKSVMSGTKATAEIKYADNYNIEELKGKTLHFEITVVSVTKTNAPEYTDAFVKSKTRYSSIKEYETELRKMVERESIWLNIVSKTEIKKYPKRFVNQYSKKFDNDYKKKMEDDNLTFEQLLSSIGLKNEEEYNQARLEYAQGVIKEEMILYRIAKDRKIRLSDKEYKKGVEELAADNGYSDKLNEFIEGYGEEELYRAIYWEKVKEELWNVIIQPNA